MNSGISTGTRRALPYVGICLIAFLVRVWLPGPVNATTDEPLWLLRSAQFSHAIAHGDLSHATAWGAVPGIDYPTMPGVPTMWAGSAGRAVMGIGHSLGINAAVPANPLASATLLRLSRAMVSLLVTIGIGLFSMVVARLIGRSGAFCAGALCAVEPWFVGHGAVLHTDALVAIFGATSLVALLVAFRSPRMGRRDSFVDPLYLAISAVTGAITVATKMNGLVIVGGGALVICTEELFRRFLRANTGNRKSELFQGVGWLAMWSGVLAAVFVAIWPITWVHPMGALHTLDLSVSHPAAIAPQFFQGKSTYSPGLLFYPVTFIFRISPWFAFGIMAVGGIAVVQFGSWVTQSDSLRPRLPNPPYLLLAALFPYTIAMAHYTRKYDRYALVFIPVFAILMGSVAAWAGRWLTRFIPRARIVVTGCLAFVALAAYTTCQAPYAISYTNPLLGGQSGAQHVLMLGWGEGAAPLGKRIAERARGHCDTTHVLRPGGNLLPLEFPCGVLGGTPKLGEGDYIVLDLNQVQRGVTIDRVAAQQHVAVQRIDQTRIGGVAYASLYVVTSSVPR